MLYKFQFLGLYRTGHSKAGWAWPNIPYHAMTATCYSSVYNGRPGLGRGRGRRLRWAGWIKVGFNGRSKQGNLASVAGGCYPNNWEAGISGRWKGQTALSWGIVTNGRPREHCGGSRGAVRGCFLTADLIPTKIWHNSSQPSLKSLVRSWWIRKKQDNPDSLYSYTALLHCPGAGPGQVL